MAVGSRKVTLELRLEDLSYLSEALYPVRAKYKFFGLQIGVDIRDIEAIEKTWKCDSDHCLLEILTARLKQKPALTCVDIVKALRSRTVNDNQVANDFESKFISDQNNEFEKEKTRAEKSTKSVPLKMSEEEIESEDESKSHQSEKNGKKVAKVERQIHKSIESRSITTKHKREICDEEFKPKRLRTLEIGSERPFPADRVCPVETSSGNPVLSTAEGIL